MTDREAFIKTIAENPDDDHCRLVFADYLEDTCEPDNCSWAELIRIQCKLSQLERECEEKDHWLFKTGQLRRVRLEELSSIVLGPKKRKNKYNRISISQNDYEIYGPLITHDVVDLVSGWPQESHMICVIDEVAELEIDWRESVCKFRVSFMPIEGELWELVCELRKRESDLKQHVYVAVNHEVLWDRGFVTRVSGSYEFYLIGVPIKIKDHPVRTARMTNWHIVEFPGTSPAILGLPSILPFLKRLELPRSRYGMDYSQAVLSSVLFQDGLIGTVADGGLEVIVDNDGNATYLRDVRAALPGIEVTWWDDSRREGPTPVYMPREQMPDFKPIYNERGDLMTYVYL